MTDSNTIVKDAQCNYNKNVNYYYNVKMRFTQPKFNKGYFAVINAIANGINASRCDIVKYINNNNVYHRGWYSDVFYRLKVANLISYTKNNGYKLTALGQCYYNSIINAFK